MWAGHDPGPVRAARAPVRACARHLCVALLVPVGGSFCFSSFFSRSLGFLPCRERGKRGGGELVGARMFFLFGVLHYPMRDSEALECE
jgi:hypothetical protein